MSRESVVRVRTLDGLHLAASVVTPDRAPESGVVLVHGGGFCATCWDQLLPHLNGRSLAVGYATENSLVDKVSLYSTRTWTRSASSASIHRP